MRAEDLAGRAVGVDRLQPGDHAFLAFCDEGDRWDVLTAFTQQGLARNEKVALVIDPGHSSAWVAARVAGGCRRRGRRRRARRRLPLLPAWRRNGDRSRPTLGDP